MFHQSPLLLRLMVSALVVSSTASAGAQTLYGAGTPFPPPLYLKWFQEYKERTGVTVNYESVGSGRSKNSAPHSLDFGVTDVPLHDEEMRAAPGILHIPTASYAVAIVYNLPGIKSGLRLTGPVLADIYLGRIARWNEPCIARLNPAQTLPDRAIFPVHQSNGGGNTSLLTSYLGAASSAWQESVGAGKSVRWPVGLGGKQGTGMAHIIAQNEGSIGYMELGDAIRDNLPCAAVQNAAGRFVAPTLTAIGSAAGSAKMPADLRGSVAGSRAAGGYPIVGFTYLLVHRDNPQPEVKNFLTWCLTTGQKDAAEFQAAPLPPDIRRRALSLIGTISDADTEEGGGGGPPPPPRPSWPLRG